MTIRQELQAKGYKLPFKLNRAQLTALKEADERGYNLNPYILADENKRALLSANHMIFLTKAQDKGFSTASIVLNKDRDVLFNEGQIQEILYALDNDITAVRTYMQTNRSGNTVLSAYDMHRLNHSTFKEKKERPGVNLFG